VLSCITSEGLSSVARGEMSQGLLSLPGSIFAYLIHLVVYRLGDLFMYIVQGGLGLCYESHRRRVRQHLAMTWVPGLRRCLLDHVDIVNSGSGNRRGSRSGSSGSGG
jgi:hypothetical protein